MLIHEHIVSINDTTIIVNCNCISYHSWRHIHQKVCRLHVSKCTKFYTCSKNIILSIHSHVISNSDDVWVIMKPKIFVHVEWFVPLETRRISSTLSNAVDSNQWQICLNMIRNHSWALWQQNNKNEKHNEDSKHEHIKHY